MPTVGKTIADKIIENDGHYMDDSPVIAVVLYNNAFNGAEAYGLCYNEGQLSGYMEGELCHNARIVYRKGVNDES